MLKLMGSVCILAAAAFARVAWIRSIRRELSVLRGLISALGEMESEIRLNRTPMPRLLKKAGYDRGADVASFFSRLSRGLAAGEETMRTWTAAAGDLPVAGRERLELAEVGRNLSGDEEKACKGILLASDHLSKCLQEKYIQQRESEKRCTALCFSGAALLIILLL